MPSKKGSISANLHMPRDEKVYKARKFQGMIRRMEGLDPTKVNLKDYILLLNTFTDLTLEIRKDKDAKRINKKNSKGTILNRRDEGAVKDESPDVDTDVSAKDTNPFAGL